MFTGYNRLAVINTALVNVTGGSDSARLAVLGQTTGDYCYFSATAWARNDVDAFDVHKQNVDLYTGSGANCITQDIWIK